MSHGLGIFRPAMLAVAVTLAATTGWAVTTRSIVTNDSAGAGGNPSDPYSEIGGSAAVAAEDSASAAGRSPVQLHFQCGFFHRLAGHNSRPGNEAFLLSWDLSFMRWDNQHATWGLGVHGIVEDDAIRMGLRGLWRMPLGMPSKFYFQLSPGIYLFGDSDNRYFKATLPAYFLEAELGWNKIIALVLSAEFTPFENSYREWMPSDPQASDGWSQSLYIGAKVGQTPGAILTVGLIITAFIALSDYSN